MTNPKILIACIGNIFLGDDGFGVEVARALAGRVLPEGVTIKDFGIRGFDLTYALLDPYDLVILVDACSRGGAPGSVYLIEPDPVAEATSTAHLDAHSIDPVSVLRMAKSMGGPANRILLVACEPEDLGEDEGKLGLSDCVAAAVREAVELIERLVAKAPDEQLVRCNS
jgi:hydrogenase maturation protease